MVIPGSYLRIDTSLYFRSEMDVVPLGRYNIARLKWYVAESVRIGIDHDDIYVIKFDSTEHLIGWLGASVESLYIHKEPFIGSLSREEFAESDLGKIPVYANQINGVLNGKVLIVASSHTTHSTIHGTISF